MLEAREKGKVDGGDAVGKFILLDAVNTQLLTCSGSPVSTLSSYTNDYQYSSKHITFI